MKFALVYGLFGICLQLTSGSQSREKAELDLITNVLLRNYSKQILPMVSFKQPVKTTIQLILRRLVEVNEKSQYITIYSGVMIKWNNPMLSWDPKQHADIDYVHLQHHRVWVPDICLYNTLDDAGNLAAKIDTAVKIDHYGNTTWLAPIQLKSECKIDVHLFPFDHQVCDLQFGSWTYNWNFIDIDPLSEQLNLSQLVSNPAWDIEEVLVLKKVGYFPEPYPYVVYRFVMKRRILYYLTNLIIPCIMISFLAFLSFCLPVQSGERIALVITMLLSMTVYMMLIFNLMPPSSEVIPLVSKFYLACIIEIALCLLATFLTIEWYYKETPMSRCIQYFINKYLARVMLFKQLKCPWENGHLDCRDGLPGHGTLEDDDVIPDREMELGGKVRHPQQENPMLIKSAKRYLAVISKKIKQDEKMTSLRKKWEYASKVVDRFFFLIFLALFIMTVVFILWNAADSEDEADRKTFYKSL